jgi:hypothetical protein
MTTDDAAAAHAETTETTETTESTATTETFEPGPPPDRTAARERHRGRSIGATVLGILTVLVLTVTVVAVWARAIVLRPEPVADLVGDAIAQPEVQQGLANYLATTAADAVDLQKRLETTLPAPLARLSPAIATGATAAAQRVLETALATPQFEQAVRTLVERAHARAMRLLEGDGIGHGITVEEGQVTLNTLPLITGALTALQSATGLFSSVQIPQFTSDGDPKQQIDELSQRVGRDLPADFGQIVVYESDSVSNAQDSVQTAQRILVLAKRAVWLLVILSVVLVAATILVAPRRLRAVLVLALGTLATMVLLRSSLRTVVDQAPDLATRPGARAAISSIVGGAARSLQRLAGVVLLIAAVTAAVVVYVRHWRRSDLILSAAVILGAVTTAAVGVGSWGLIVGVLVGIAVPFVARWLLPLMSRPPSSPEATPTEAAATAAGGA